MINNDLDLRELITIHQRKLELENKEAELSTPKLTDQELIPMIFEWFSELSHCNTATGQLTSDEKIQFLFVIMKLYSPISLAGGRTVKGLRDKMAKIYGYTSPSGVSNNIKKMMDMYSFYRPFQKVVHTYYEAIIDRLIEHELISQK